MAVLTALFASIVVFRPAAGIARQTAAPAHTGLPPQAAPPAPPPGSPQKEPDFRSTVDLVIVEATVLDRSGAVARGLGRTDFQVEIDGRPREVVAADLVEYASAEAPRHSNPDVTTNESVATSRHVLLLVDQGSLRTENKSVLETAGKWLATLGPTDRVGLVAIPPPGPRVEFTTDRAPIVGALRRITFLPALPPPFSNYNVSLWEAIHINEGEDIVFGEVVARECTARDPFCVDNIRANASAMANDALSRARPVVNAIRGLVRALNELPGPKHVVLVSGGWGLDERHTASEMSAIAADAAKSNTTVHTFTVEQWATSASVSRPSPRIAMDRDLLVNNAEMISGLTGGRAVRLTGDGQTAFASLSAGLAGYYRLGVRPAPEDLDGKTRRISVKVSRRGVTLSGYRKVMAGGLAKSAPAPVDTTTALREALRSNTPFTGLDLSATSYVLHGETGNDTLRVIVAGDVSRASTGAATAATVLYDLNGKSIVGTEVPLEVTADGRGRVSTALVTRPGNYVLRLAVRDAEGRIGSVERPVDARWKKVGNIETTGLVLIRDRGTAREPLVDTVSRTDRLVVQVSFSTPVSAATTQVTFDVLRDGSTAPLMHLTGRIAKTTAGATVAQETVAVSVLPPGRYTLSASIQPGKTPPFTRSFTVSPDTADASPTAGAAPAGTPPGAAPTTTPAAAIPATTSALPKAPPFSTAAVLDPGFVAPVLERLAGRPDVAAVRDAVNGLKSGPWPADGDKSPVAGAPVASFFVAGLGRLQRGNVEDAAAAFRATLRAAPDFTPAMVYLGACYAAGGKDREAASAWQAAILREPDRPEVQRLAIEAWLRADRPAAALALVRQARTRFPDEEAFVGLQARASLADGKRQEGLELLDTVTKPDESLLLLALGTLYEAARTRTPVWDPPRDLETMRRLRETYAATNGSSVALVDAWLAEIAAASQP
jgi:VWFA-related protein